MPRAGKLRASVSPYEILFPESQIFVESEDPLDARSAQSGIIVRGQKGRVHVSREGRKATWSMKDAPLAAGQHTLIMEELLTSSGEKIPEAMEIPFFVTDSRAKVPSSLRIESMVRLRIGKNGTERVPSDERRPGKFIEIMKATNRETGAPMELAFNEAGQKIDTQEIFTGIQNKQARGIGKLHESLSAHIRNLGTDARIEVAVWLRSPEMLHMRSRRTREQPGVPPREVQEQRKRIDDLTEQFSTQLRSETNAPRMRTDRLAPVLYAELTRAQVIELARRPEVAAIFLHETKGIDDLGSSIAVANSDDVHSLGFRGSRVKVAVWEDGPDNTTNLTITAFYDSTQTNQSDHARHTHGIVKNKQPNKPKGHAPSCSLHSANDKDLDALAWAVKEKNCTVVSQSFHRSSEPGSAGLSFDDIYKDWLALHWPYPTILQAAGNFWEDDPDNIDPPNSEFVNHKGYNSLAVGNHNDSASGMSGSSVFRNPSTPHGDRELPEVSANGTSVTTVGLTKSGTSMAAPAAAGSAALIQNVNTTLKSWPEGCRAILLAGAKRNVSGNNWWQDVTAAVDANDGSGAVDAHESTRITQSKRSRNSAATRRGWDVGSFESRDFDGNGLSTFAYKVRVPDLFFGPRHVKVALAWTSRVSTMDERPLSSSLTVDLDLMIFDSRGNLVGYSGSWDNSYEIAEFTGRRGETYTIRIRRWSGTDQTYYGLAWTVTGGLLFAEGVARRDSVLEDILNSSLARRRANS
jgi:hypothetical protein